MLSVLSGSLLIFLPPSRQQRRVSGGSLRVPAVQVFLIVAATVLLLRGIHRVPGLLIAYGRYAATRIGESDIIYTGEGMTASVAVSRTPNGVLNYHNAGKVQASSEPQDMRLQRMLGHLTTLEPCVPW